MRLKSRKGVLKKGDSEGIEEEIRGKITEKAEWT